VSLIKPDENAGDVNDGQEVRGRLLEAAGNGAKALDVMEEAFNLVAKSIASEVFATTIVFSRRIHRDHWFHTSRSNRVDNAVGIVTSVSH